MLKKLQEIVITFRDESGELVGALVQSGTSHFYRMTPANKDYVAQLLGVEDTTTKK